MRPLLVIAGTFAPQQFSYAYYAPLRPTRVVALPGGGRSRLHRTYAALSPIIQEWALQQDEPIVVAGHSQGAIHALTFALDNPHLVDEVVGIAGPYDGANTMVIRPNLQRHVKRVIPVALDFQRGSSYLRGLQERASASTTPITLVAGATDRLVTVRSSHAIDPADKVVFNGSHTTVLRQRDTKHLLREIRERH